jgi:hypothetical protein
MPTNNNYWRNCCSGRGYRDQDASRISKLS